MRLLREPAGRVQPVDAGSAALVGVDVLAGRGYRPLHALEVTDLVFRRGDDVPGSGRVAGVAGVVRVVTVDLNDEPGVVDRFVASGFDALALTDRRHSRRTAVEPVGPRSRPARRGGRAGAGRPRPAGSPEVLQVRVPPQERPAVVDYESVEPLPGREHGRREAGDAAADDDHVAEVVRIAL